MPTDSHEIPLACPQITDTEIEAVTDALRSGRLSNGPWLQRFETLLAQRVGRRHAVGVSSGTAALHVVLEALGIGEGDEVITTPFSFIATANAVRYTGATPVFADIDPITLNLDPTKAEAAITDRTRAILAVETFGNPAGMEQLASLARGYELPLIEDACEALGSTHKGKPVGAFGRAAVFAFYANKQITTGEGGMIVTDDTRLAELCRSMRSHGRPADPPGENGADPAGPAHPRHGFNYRMSELHAALGAAQIQRLDELMRQRRELACLYFEKLMDQAELILPNVDEQTAMSWFVYAVRLNEPYTAKQRDRILTGLRRHEIGCAAYFPPIHLQPPYRHAFGHKEGDFPVTESVAARTLALPFFPGMDGIQVELVTLTLRIMLQREGLLHEG